MSSPPSRWIYPLPINHEFRDKFWEEEEKKRNRVSDDYVRGEGVQDLFAATVRNLTQNERSDRGEGPNPELFKNTLGRESLPVHVNDIVVPSWTESDSDMFPLTDMVLDCMICTAGAGKGGLFSACDDFTNLKNLTVSSDSLNLKPDTQPGVTIPPLSGDPEFPIDACAVCALTICTVEGCKDDHSVPFPVLHKKRDKPWIFDENLPNGTEFDAASYTPPPSTSRPQPTASLSPIENDSKEGSDKSDLVLAIVTPIVLVLAGAVLIWILLTMRRNRRRAKALRNQQSIPAFPPSTGFAQLRDPPAVNRQQETDENGEAPPSYTEAVGDRRINENPAMTVVPR